MAWNAGDGPPFVNPYTPSVESVVPDWLLAADIKSPGLLGLWPGRRGIWNPAAAGAARPTFSRTSLNGTPGVTGNGISNVMTAPLDCSSATALRLVCTIQGVSPPYGSIFSLGPWSLTPPGAVNLFAHDTNGGNVGVYAQGSVGLQGYQGFANSSPLAAPTLLSACMNTTFGDSTTGTLFIRVNGHEVGYVTVVATPANTNPLLNALSYLFSNNAGAFYGGTLGCVVPMFGAEQDDALIRVEKYAARTAKIAYPNTLMCCGDSITIGSMSFTGGYRPAVLSALGAGWTGIGPNYNSGSQDGTGAQSAAAVVASLGAFKALLKAYAPDAVTLGWGTVDLTTLGDSPATVANNFGILIDAVHEVLPRCAVKQLSVVPATTGAHQPNYPILNAMLPAVCAAHRATFVDIGSPPTSDGIHPTDPGYAAMAVPIAASF